MLRNFSAYSDGFTPAQRVWSEADFRQLVSSGGEKPTLRPQEERRGVDWELEGPQLVRRHATLVDLCRGSVIPRAHGW